MSFKKVESENKIRPEGKNCVLVHGYKENEVKVLESYIKKVGIDNLLEIKPTNTHNTLEEILQESFDKNDNLEKIDERAVVFNAVSDFELNTFIQNYKKTKLDRPLFAVVTENSRDWKFSELLEELVRERESFKNRKK